MHSLQVQGGELQPRRTIIFERVPNVAIAFS